ncbi:MAG: SDR family NAD(P)-dependent oxidoreductase [Ignavibacteriales bacterium]|nr:MAG: SDR family NAD(P)-dependent oxidoreductase [Ignavibacteriales bacterium]
MKLKSINILLTGASSGIGYALAKRLAAEGANLALASRSKDTLDKLANELSSSTNKIAVHYCDVSDKSSIVDCVKNVTNDFGTIDIAILNSGVSIRSQSSETKSGIAENIFAVNTLSIHHFNEALLPVFKKNKESMLVGVTSLADVRGFPGSGLYSASKAAASTLLECMRIELKKLNIKVIIVKPGFVKTPMTDKNEFLMPFMLTADKAAHIIVKGIKREKKIISFPFPIVWSTKILRVMPDWLFDFLLSCKLPAKK